MQLTSHPFHHLSPGSDSSQQSFLQTRLSLLRLLQGLCAHLISTLLPLHTQNTQHENVLMTSRREDVFLSKSKYIPSLWRSTSWRSLSDAAVTDVFLPCTQSRRCRWRGAPVDGSAEMKACPLSSAGSDSDLCSWWSTGNTWADCDWSLLSTCC